MSGQLGLFDAPPTAGRSRRSDPETSREAAKTARVAHQRNTILRELAGGGKTADDLAGPCGTHRSVVSSRLAQMRRDGQVECVGTVENDVGRRVQLWVLADRGVVDVDTGGRL